MTAQPLSEEFEARTISSFAQARSDALDRFNQLEIAVLKLEHRFCAMSPPRGMPLNQRMTALATLKPGSSCPESILQQIQKLMRECETLLPLRATIVHSTMKVRKRNKGRVAIFQNSFDEAHAVPLFAVMTEGDFERLGATLQRLTIDLTDLRLGR